MSERKINLNKLFDNNYDHKTMINRSVMSKEKFIEVCLIFGKQLLELAAKNAKLKEDIEYPFMPTIKGKFEGKIISIIDKQSILDIINQVE